MAPARSPSDPYCPTGGPARPARPVRTWGLGTLAEVRARARLAWLRRHAQVGDGVRVAPDAELRGALHRLEVGAGVTLGRGVVLRIEEPGGRLRLGDGTRCHEYVLVRTQQGTVDIGRNVAIQPFGVINGEGGVRIGDDVSLAPRCTIISSTHVFDDPGRPIRLQPVEPRPVEIGDDVWIGAGATVLGGVTIGRGAVVGAGAVVNADVAPFAVVAGVPARPIGRRGP